MEMNSRYYEEMFERFLEECSMWADDVVSYRPKHMHAIRVTLRNGDYVDYNYKTGFFQYHRAGSEVHSARDLTDEDCRAVFASNLSEFMRTRGFGQAILSERTGLSQGIISRYLTKKSTPSITNLKKIAEVLDCHYEELLE